MFVHGRIAVRRLPGQEMLNVCSDDALESCTDGGGKRSKTKTSAEVGSPD
jgi:hypothetical protein